MSKKILLIDDHSILLEAVRMLLESRINNVQVLTATSLNEALSNSLTPDIVILDIKLDGINGIDGIGILKEKWRSTRIVILSSQDDQTTQQLTLDRGAVSFVSKAKPSDEIVSVIGSILVGDFSVTNSIEHGLLTPRQYEVLDLLCRGLSNKMIARQLDLSENTVRRHNQDIFAFFQVASRTEAVFKAKQMGIIN